MSCLRTVIVKEVFIWFNNEQENLVYLQKIYFEIRRINMKLLIFILNKTEKLDALLTELANHDFSGATVLDSMGMARLLSHKHDEDEIPFLGSLRVFLNPEREKSKVIFAAIQDEQLTEAVDIIESIVGDLSGRDTGVIFSVPIDYTKGICKIGE